MFAIVRSDNTIVEHPKSGKRWYTRVSAAKAAKTRMSLDDSCVIVTEKVYAMLKQPTKKVRNLMSGAEVEIPVDTPHCCDPSSETYWSM